MESAIPSQPLPGHGSDRALLARIRAGDGAAFGELIARHQDRVYQMAYRMLGNREDALDLAQEVFVTVFRGLDGFKGEAKFSTWLYSVTTNRCRDELRRRQTVKHTRPHSLDGLRASRDDEGRAFEPATPAAGPAAEVQAAELQRAVQTAIASLPVDAREILVLRDTQDFGYAEIAEILAIPVGTVRSRLNRARQLIRDELAPLLGDRA